MHISSLSKDCLKQELSYTILCYIEWQTFRWSVTVELILTVRSQSVLPLLFKMYICIHLNLTQTTGLSLAGKWKFCLWIYNKSPASEPSSCKLLNMWTCICMFNHMLVPMYGIHCVCMDPLQMVVLLSTVQHCMEFSSTVLSLSQAQDVWKEV